MIGIFCGSALCALYAEVCSSMEAEGLHQWHFGTYPSRQTLTEDIERGELYCADGAEGPAMAVTVSERELRFQKAICVKIKAEVEAATGEALDFKFGTMIEIPRAALTADRMARTAEFFSFGTNDLTQMTFGFSRDDVGTFMGEYLGHKLLDGDPFQTIDVKAVGKLVELGIQGGRSKRPELKCGVCGEHGGDPDSVHFFNRIGVDYVSCSPFRVPIARLAAAQAAIKQK